MYNVAEGISDCWRPLRKKQYSIDDTKNFPKMLSSVPPLQDDKEDVSYNVGYIISNIISDMSDISHPI